MSGADELRTSIETAIVGWPTLALKTDAVLDVLASSVSCWYCPDCGLVLNLRIDLDGRTGEGGGHIGGLPGWQECHGIIVEGRVVPWRSS